MTAELAEAVFLAAAILGVAFSGLGWLDAWQDWRVVRNRSGKTSPVLKLIARRDVRAGQCATGGFMLLVAAVSLVHFWGNRTVAWWMLAGAAAMLSTSAVLDARVRAEVLLRAAEACDDEPVRKGESDD